MMDAKQEQADLTWFPNPNNMLVTSKVRGGPQGISKHILLRVHKIGAVPVD